MVTDLHSIEGLANEKEIENDLFKAFLQNQDTADIDKLVFRLNETVSSQIDCTACGNCCKSLLINVTEAEADRLSKQLGQSRAVFDETYLEKSTHAMVINQIPCHFLNDNKCTVYEHRFAGCSEFPALHIPQFNKRLFTVFMHYHRCPIIYNVVEALKKHCISINKKGL